MKKLIYSGSVKNIFTTEVSDELMFEFSDRYSVFDWGQMPDLLNNKGESLAHMGKLFFELLEDPQFWKSWQGPMNLDKWQKDILDGFKSSGLKTHYVKKESPANCLIVKKVNVPKLDFKDGSYDYSIYLDRPKQTLIPLEVVFRFGMPAGSSLVKRISDVSYCESLGLRSTPRVGETFSTALIEYSTKLESSDRYVSYDRAQAMASLSDEEFSKLHSYTQILCARLYDFFKDQNIELWDGKFEWAFGDELDGVRELILVDSIGPDELRLGFEQHKLSKEFLRSFYRNTDWLENVEQAKVLAKDRGDKDWKSIVIDQFNSTPSELSSSYKRCADALYPSLANHFAQYTSREKPFSPEFTLESLGKLMDSLGD